MVSELVAPVWSKREAVTLAHYTDIWDGDGWQINRGLDGRYWLIDATMPHQIPASPIMGNYATLEEAQQASAGFGPTDWTEALQFLLGDS
jgi:hypothetical protein